MHTDFSHRSYFAIVLALSLLGGWFAQEIQAECAPGSFQPHPLLEQQTFHEQDMVHILQP